jgi:hypothetical protein
VFNNKFYWQTIRKSIVAFGNMFNNIHIDRTNSDGAVTQTLRVPLAYAPKQKFLARIAAQPQSFEQSFETYLPRIGFEMTGIQYDPSRRVSLVQQNRALNGTSTTTLNSQYAPTPYNIAMTLYVYTKNQDDGLQIVEQILPYFNPDYNLTLNAIPAMGIKNDLPIILDSVNYEDEYEGDFSQRRAIIWTLSFTMKLNFYGPINNRGIIKTTNVKTFSDAALSNQQTSYTASVDPNTAVPGDDIAIIDNFEDF